MDRGSSGFAQSFPMLGISVRAALLSGSAQCGECLRHQDFAAFFRVREQSMLQMHKKVSDIRAWIENAVIKKTVFGKNEATGFR